MYSSTKSYYNYIYIYTSEYWGLCYKILIIEILSSFSRSHDTTIFSSSPGLWVQCVSPPAGREGGREGGEGRVRGREGGREGGEGEGGRGRGRGRERQRSFLHIHVYLLYLPVNIHVLYYKLITKFTHI